MTPGDVPPTPPSRPAVPDALAAPAGHVAPVAPDAPTAPDRLDAALDGIPGRPWPDPALAETAERLRALAGRAAPPGPSPAFVRHLEETLMRQAATSGATVFPEATRMNGNGYHPAAALPPSGRVVPGHPPRRLSPGALATAAAVVLLLGGIALGGWLASSPGDGGEPGRLGAAQEATSAVPAPAECTMSPQGRRAAVPAGTPRARLFSPAETEVLEAELPTGPDPDAGTVAGITATLREIVACSLPASTRSSATPGVIPPPSTAQDPSALDTGTDRVLALYSDGFIAEFDRRQRGEEEGAARYWAPPIFTKVSLREARVLPDGRVGAVVEGSFAPTFFVFVEEDGRWLVDEFVTLREESVVPVATVGAFAPDYYLSNQFSANLRAEPSTRATIVRALPPGAAVEYLGEQTASEDPATDGPRWLRFRTIEGDSGWLREIDVASFAAPESPEVVESWSMVPTIAPDPGAMHATATAIPESVVPTTAVAPASAFAPTHQSNPAMSLNFRSEPNTTGGNGTIVTVLPPATPLLFLGETAPADNPAEDGDRWLRFRLEDGTEGWLREIDAEAYPAPGA